MAPPLDLIGPPCLRLPPSPPAGGSPNQPPPTHHPLTSSPPKNPCLDLFYSDTLLPNLAPLLKKAWDHDPMTTLKLLCGFSHARVAGESSADEVFFAAVLWLHQHHPLTLACNVKVLARLGSLKDLLEVLYRVLEPSQAQRTQKKIERVEKNGDEREGDMEKKKKEIERAKRAVERYASDADYRFLHNRITDLFAELLEFDLRFLELGEIEKIRLACKWCPSLDSFYDKLTLICEAIARKLFPRESEIAYREIEEAHYAYRVRDRLRKQVLLPLRKALESTNHGSSDAMRRTQKRFVKKEHKETFRVYQKSYKRLFVEDGDERYRVFLQIADGCGVRRLGLLPHRIVASVNKGRCIAELQWRRLVEDLSKKGHLKNCLAVCNVSEGMRGTPMDVSIAMGLLISELNEHPWKGMVFSFSSDPKLVKIEGDNLRSKVEFMKQMQCGSNIRFSTVFDQLLQVAVNENLSQDKMVKKIFVFTDEPFEKAANNFWASWASLFIYRRRGYETLPEIVFWNLGGSATAPPATKREGLTTVNRFSDSKLAMILERGVVPTLENVAKSVATPEDVMKSAISREEFGDLFVLD